MRRSILRCLQQGLSAHLGEEQELLASQRDSHKFRHSIACLPRRLIIATCIAQAPGPPPRASQHLRPQRSQPGTHADFIHCPGARQCARPESEPMPKTSSSSQDCCCSLLDRAAAVVACYREGHGDGPAPDPGQGQQFHAQLWPAAPGRSRRAQAGPGDGRRDHHEGRCVDLGPPCERCRHPDQCNRSSHHEQVSCPSQIPTSACFTEGPRS